MNSLLHIDLLSFQSGLKLDHDKAGMPVVFDPLRKKNIRSTPEEIVRQLWIIYFLQELHINPRLMAVERAFIVSGAMRRFDLVIFSNTTLPFLLAEFKAPGQGITQSVFDQIGHYNMQLQVPYALVSNGGTHYCFEINDEKKAFVFRTELPFK